MRDLLEQQRARNTALKKMKVSPSLSLSLSLYLSIHVLIQSYIRKINMLIIQVYHFHVYAG